MTTLIIDIGNSFTKFYVYQDGSLESEYLSPTPKDKDYDMIESLLVAYRCTSKKYDIDRVLPMSYSDAVWYEDKHLGTAHHLSAMFGTPQVDALPPYKLTGQPMGTELRGIAGQLFYLKNEVGLENIKRILPASTFLAARLSGQTDWNTWDITHASNTGMWDYGRGTWVQEMAPFLEAGVIDERVVKPDAWMTDKWLVGGHDSVFASANELPYSTKPYLSLGTWITASMQYLPCRDEQDDGTRWVVAPNGAILKQICFPSDDGYNMSYDRVIRFFEKVLPRGIEPRNIKVFGGWAKKGHRLWKNYPNLNFELKEEDLSSYLHNQAAIYAEAAV